MSAAAGPRVIVVTGGANGLGAAMVRHFTAAGHRVAAADVDEESGRRLADATGCLFIPADVAVLADNQAVVAQAAERFGGIDALCLNAGIGGGTSVGDGFDPDRYRRCMQVNLDGPVFGANAAVPHMRARGAGSILITSSIAGFTPSPDLYYSTAKHALIGLARSLALVLYQDKITVNAICPGFIDTRIIASARDALISHGIALASPEEVAAAAAEILDSPATGQAWEVQAGRPPTRVELPKITLSREAAAPATPGPTGDPDQAGR
jgi:NAD(P)-dependent dehydrogenase (short-subunit alcohol dehydrogenase family)